ncbi:MAG: hypothetical protein HZA89_07515 [Verrucomicrobia bacterium]|nr:hypothetical protein [Verrucomicrobiota bacterium]
MPLLPDISIPQNERVIAYLTRHGPKPLLAAPDSVRDAYYGLGSHPDIVERVWDGLGRALPRGSRWIVCGTPGLVQPASGVILAFACGTQYCLRLPDSVRDEALKAGVKMLNKWSGGEVMDTQHVLGKSLSEKSTGANVYASRRSMRRVMAR